MGLTFGSVRENYSKTQAGVHSFLTLSLCLWPLSCSPGRKRRKREGEKVEEGFPWLREAHSFSCETQYP